MSLVEYFAPLVPILNDSILSEEKFDLMATAIDILPREFSWFLSGFESDLLSDEKTADFFVSVSKYGKDCDTFIRQITEKLKKSPLSSEESWQKFIELLSKWQTFKLEETALENVWIEFDFRNDLGNIANPSFFFGNRSGNSLFGSDGDNLEDSLKMIEFIGSNFLGTESEKVKEFASSHIKEIPIGAKFSHLGVMLGRANPEIRFFIRNFSAASLVSYLQNIKSALDLEMISKHLSDLAADSFALQYNPFDTADSIGVECFIHPSCNMYRNQFSLFETIRDKYHCNQLKTEFLKTIDRTMQREVYEISSGRQRYSADTMRVGFHHLKLKFRKNGVESVKGYLWTESVWK